MTAKQSVRLQCETLETRDVPAALTNLFDAAFYLQHNPDVAVAVQRGVITSEVHFRRIGEAEHRQGNALFDDSFYLSHNPDVAAAVQSGAIRSAFHHFELSGQFENRPSSELFDGNNYLNNNPDVRNAVNAGLTTAFSHFFESGEREDRHGLTGFNPDVYLDDYPDVRNLVERGLLSATQHFLLFGELENRHIEDGNDRQSNLNPPPNGGSSADPFVVSGLSQNSADKQFYIYIPSRSGTVNVTVQSSNGTFAKVSVETSQSVTVFETDPKDGMNSGSFSTQSGISYFLRVRAPENSPASYTVTLDLV